MNQITLTQQASPVDEQALFKAELNAFLATQAETVAPAKDPLNDRERQIIATIIERTPEEIKTIWIEGGITVWVQFMDGGRLPFDCNWFSVRVAEVKATLPETPRERNERLSAELEAACKKFNLWHGEIDWLSFSTKVFRDGRLLGFVGCNREGWYSRRHQYGPSQQVTSGEAAITSLGVRVAVAA
jgi:hypothetical protein